MTLLSLVRYHKWQDSAGLQLGRREHVYTNWVKTDYIALPRTMQVGSMPRHIRERVWAKWTVSPPHFCLLRAKDLHSIHPQLLHPVANDTTCFEAPEILPTDAGRAISPPSNRLTIKCHSLGRVYHSAKLLSSRIHRKTSQAHATESA